MENKAKIKKSPLVEVRCANPGCNRLLAETRGDTAIRCRRCKGMTVLNYQTGNRKYFPKEDKNAYLEYLS